ncbi:MAG: 3-isopropylmalate dehydrogenase [Christensenellales bacterium]|jgi:3-isopropylmalate dehydrogenase|nr:3-isopropylmalate dehydrogenase [Eubacteriales bacterium]
MKYKIAVIEGDGIGPEIMAAALGVLGKVAEIFGHRFEYAPVLAGGASIDRFGVPLAEEALKTCLECDSVMLAAVGGPKWDTLPGHLRPERALLAIRKELGLFANIRPAKLISSLAAACPLKPEIRDKGIDLVIIRELTGGIYYGARGRSRGENGEEAYDTERYSEKEIERIARVAFELAKTRKKKLASVDKANVLESSRLWRETVHRLGREYPEIEITDVLVDNAAMQLIKNPSQFDVVVTANMFGDILSDEASQITGSIGLLPSASLGEGSRGMYEPIHGSAPDIAGKNAANPIATILSAAMMLRLSFGLEKEAAAVERAVYSALDDGLRTRDILDNGTTPLTCSEMAEAVIKRLSL